MKKESVLYTIPTSFFEENKFLENLARELKIMEGGFSSKEKPEAKDSFNAFFDICMSQASKQNKYKVIILFYQTLINYAQFYRCTDTFDNLIEYFERDEDKDEFASQEPFYFKYLYSSSLFGRFNTNSIDGIIDVASQDDIRLLLKAKKNGLKIYLHHIEDKNKLTDVDFYNSVVLLIAILTQLWRWTESMSYINVLTRSLGMSPHLAYLKVQALFGIKHQTCLNFNGLLQLELLDTSNYALRKIENRQTVPSLNKILKETEKDINEFKIDIPKHRNHQQINESHIKSLKGYELFCETESLFINEHGFFCGCDFSRGDKLEIETLHHHTQIKWVKKYQLVLDTLIADFAVARSDFYRSDQNNRLTGMSIDSVGRDHRSRIQNSLLKYSFKACYSILDTIGITILDALGINHKDITKGQNENEHPTNIYFLNLWDLNLIDDNTYRHNQNLFALYSIAKDLDKTNQSALKSFKNIRNAMEHKVLIVGDGKKEGDFYYISKDNLTKKCMLLLSLTRSAIFSYTYFIRRQSKILEDKQ